MRKSRANIIRHFPTVLSQPPIISSPRDFLTMGWFPCSANLWGNLTQHVCPVHPWKAKEEDEDSLFQLCVPHHLRLLLPLAKGIWGGGWEQLFPSFPGIPGAARSLTPAIWLPGIMDDPCTRWPDRGGMAGCKESLRSSVLICKKEQRNCRIKEQGGGMSRSSGKLGEAPLRDLSAVSITENQGYSTLLLSALSMDSFPALPSPLALCSIKTFQETTNFKQLFKV